MASRLNPYLTFNANAREAMEVYQRIFGGDLTLTTFGEFGAPDPAIAGQIMHGQLQTDAGYTLMGADNPPGSDFNPGNTITISLSGDDAADLHRYWDALIEGGNVTVPLEKQMWGDEFGQCVDRFGVGWLINIGQPPA
jgi:PhnB protein